MICGNILIQTHQNKKACAILINRTGFCGEFSRNYCPAGAASPAAGLTSPFK
jgi:hypothetical protein